MMLKLLELSPSVVQMVVPPVVSAVRLLLLRSAKARVHSGWLIDVMFRSASSRGVSLVRFLMESLDSSAVWHHRGHG